MNARALSLSTIASDLASLTKPRLSSLVLVTTAGGMWLAPGALSPARAIATLLAIAGTVGAANAFNCYIERDVDRLMARTRNRPLPAGRMEPQVALWFGISLVAISLPTLAFEANVLTALLGLVALCSYVWIYTPLKARSYTAMLVGAVPGALPPLMGWTAVTGRIQWPGVLLFGILFFWQIPHFIAIALFLKDEYRAAGLKSLPVERGEQVSRAQLLAYVLALCLVALLPPLTGMAGWLYGAAALALNVVFVSFALQGFIGRLGNPWARKVFRFSLVYLAGIFAAFWIDAVLHR